MSGIGGAVDIAAEVDAGAPRNVNNTTAGFTEVTVDVDNSSGVTGIFLALQ